MSLPAWIRDRLSSAPDGPEDTWEGQPLPPRNVTHTEIHWRTYDQRTGALLSFGSTNVLDVIVRDALAVQRAHPRARLHVVQLDGPAH